MLVRYFSAVSCFAVLLITAAGFAHADAVPGCHNTDELQLATKSGDISEQEAQKLEEKLRADPNDFELRIRLLGYYNLKAFQSQAARQARQKHVLWVIKNRPMSQIAGSPYAQLDPILDGDAYSQAKNLWLQQVKAHDKDPVVFGNAASCLWLHDPAIAENLLKQAQSLEPDNPSWAEQLGHLYSLGLRGQSGEKRKQTASEALTQYEKAYGLSPKGTMRFYLLSDLAEAALDVGDFTKAQKYATDLLDQASQYKSDWNYGNAIHDANLVLGRLALNAGDVKKAGDHLLAAGKTSGSPQLDSFGPNMELAKELLEKGQRDVVLQYFGLCAKFWDMGKDELEAWTVVVRAGKMPDFGANLDY